MPEVLDWQRATDPRQVIDRAARALAEGQLVAFPTETVYGIAASVAVPEAVERLARSKGRPTDKPLALAVDGLSQALEWVPDMGTVGRRLARRCWPGPVTLVCGDGVDRGRAARLPDNVRRRVCRADAVGLRTPDHDAILKVLERVPEPLVLTSANRSGEPDAATPQEVLDSVGEELALVIDDGPSRFGKSSTVVRVEGHSWNVLREGVVSTAAIERLAGSLIVFICTGNTCRSPLAEALCKKLLAERLACRPEELPARGFIVTSAGLAAVSGGHAALEAIEVARELGADLTGHCTRPLTAELAAQADFLIAMTQGHVMALTDEAYAWNAEPRLLCADGGDVPDPIGCDQPVYRECARQILAELEKLLPKVLQS
jgi:protein-tyrosine phosphatase